MKKSATVSTGYTILDTSRLKSDSNENKRITATVTARQKKTIELASLISGRSESDILATGGMRESVKILREHVIPLFDFDESALFNERMAQAPAPNAALLTAALEKWNAINK